MDAAGTALLYAGYIGGSGSSTEASFPDGDGLGPLGGPDGTYNGGGDGFVVKIAAPGTSGISEIPTLSGLGMTVLALCLAGLALGMLLRRLG